MANESAVATVMRIDSLILSIRGQRVMLDSDLARIYAVTTGQLNQALKRNSDRFPADFAFQLAREEFAALLSQSVISKTGRGGRQTVPWVFTEHGAIMLASVLNSAIAIRASVRVVRAFVYLRDQLAANLELAKKFAELERRMDKQDKSIVTLFEAIRQLLEPATPVQPNREIGFHIKEDAVPYRIKVNRRR
jgi:cell division protein FtsB